MKFIDIVVGFIKEQKTLFFIYFLILLTLPLKDIIFPRLIGNLYSSIKEGKEFFTVGAWIIGIIVFLQIIGTVSDYIELQFFMECRPIMPETYRQDQLGFQSLQV